MKTRELVNHADDLKDKIFNENEEQLIRIDSLTKLPNYYYFMDMFIRKWKDANRKQIPVSLLLFDVDHLKQYNEVYSIEEGNLVLKNIFEKIQSLLKRPEDFLACYGECKFIILLPETDINGSLLVAEKLRKGVEELEIPNKASTTSEFVTISVGVGTKTPKIWEDPLDFIRAVEQAMQNAKKNGRNQVIWSNVFLKN